MLKPFSVLNMHETNTINKNKIPVVKNGLTLFIAFLKHSSNSTVRVLHWEKCLPIK